MRDTNLLVLRTKAASAALTLRLVEAVRKSNSGSPASRLWAEAYEAVIVPLKSLFEKVESDYPSKVRSAKHWAVLIDRLERDAAFVTDTQWLHDGNLSSGQSHLHRYAVMNDWKVADCLDVWMSQGNALREAVEELGIELTIPDQLPRDLIGVCTLCWRTGQPAKRGDGFFCQEHRDVSSPAYQRAHERLEWRDPRQPPEPRISFVWHYVREIRAKLPRPLIAEPIDLVPMSRACRGIEVPESSFPHITFDVGRNAAVLKRVNRHFKLEKVKPNAKSQLRFLAMVDPKLPALSDLQHRMHKIMVQDNRILLDRLMYAEACLEADQRRRSNRGPESMVSSEESNRIVVPFYFSYRGMEYVKEL